MDTAPKSPPPENYISDYISGKFQELIDGLSPDIPIKEELIEEVMQELYNEITTNSTTTSAATTISDCTKLSSSPPASFPTASTVAGNWNCESCGASISDTASTMMAGINFVGGAGKAGALSPENEVGAWSECGSNDPDGLVVGKGAMDGCDAGQVVDDEWLERVLSAWGPEDVDGWL